MNIRNKCTIDLRKKHDIILIEQSVEQFSEYQDKFNKREK